MFPSNGFTAAVSVADVVNKKMIVKSLVCQTDLTWVSSDTPLQTVHSVVHVSGSPGSVSTGTQASSVKSGPASADARALCARTRVPGLLVLDPVLPLSTIL